VGSTYFVGEVAVALGTAAAVIVAPCLSDARRLLAQGSVLAKLEPSSSGWLCVLC
jgi:hypothetical protein